MNMLFLLLKSQLPCIIKNVNDKLQLKFGVIWNSSHLPQEFAFNLLGNLHNLKALSKHLPHRLSQLVRFDIWRYKTP